MMRMQHSLQAHTCTRIPAQACEYDIYNGYQCKRERAWMSASALGPVKKGMLIRSRRAASTFRVRSLRVRSLRVGFRVRSG